MKKKKGKSFLRSKELFIILGVFLSLYMLSSCDWVKELLENQAPTACFTMDPESGLFPLTVIFNASCSEDPENNISTYTWDFGDGDSGTGMSVSHIFTSPGTYTVQLTVSDDEGLKNATTDTVDVTRVKWIYEAEKPVYYSTPAVASDGTVYFATGIYLHSEFGSLHALYPDGTLKWSRDLENNGYSPSIGSDGTVYVQDSMAILYAFTSTGTLKWKHNTNNCFLDVGKRTPAIGNDGAIYFGGLCLEAVYTNGTLKWSNDDVAIVTTSPIIGPDRSIFVITGRGEETLYKVNRVNGNIIWQSTIEFSGEHFNAFSAPSIDSTGTIYFGAEMSYPNYGGYVYAVRSNGTLKWRYFVAERYIRSTPTIGPDGTIYAGTKVGNDHTSKLIALYHNGTLKWEYIVESIHEWDDIYCTPTIGADGTIYFGAETGYLYALNQSGTLLWQQELQHGNNWSSPAITTDGTLYIGTIYSDWTGNLYAIKTSSLGLAASVWPKFHHDNKNTGRY
ncbi:MAG: PQQ-binding-like beta-propeller repeat protein [Candidatus Aminicenantes bacterium]|nr:PQQ-binding-like beta-propeller repeat protein [Candidatus Aminicenantes bacterium]